MQCQTKQYSKIELVEAYINSRHSKNFKNINKVIHDNLTVQEGDYKMEYTKNSFYEVFKWDSIFQTSYEILDIKQKDNHVDASIEMNSKRHDYLRNSNMRCTFRFLFTANKISTIQTLECEGVDWSTWQMQVKSLVNWTVINHPELDGFIHDMTMEGAIKYIKAIEMYKKSH